MRNCRILVYVPSREKNERMLNKHSDIVACAQRAQISIDTPDY